jgi:hypothetical protein
LCEDIQEIRNMSWITNMKVEVFDLACDRELEKLFESYG